MLMFKQITPVFLINIVLGFMSHVGLAQTPCSSTVSCAQVAVEAVVQQLQMRIEELEKVSGRIEVGTLILKNAGTYRIEFPKPAFANPPHVFVSVTGIEAYNLQQPDGTHLYVKNIGVENIDSVGAVLRTPDFGGSGVYQVSVSWIAIGK
jgi:hypothetical protein